MEYIILQPLKRSTVGPQERQGKKKSFFPPKPPRQPALRLRCLLLDLPVHLIHTGIELVLGLSQLIACFLSELGDAFVGFAACAGVVDLYDSRLASSLEKKRKKERKAGRGMDVPPRRY